MSSELYRSKSVELVTIQNEVYIPSLHTPLHDSQDTSDAEIEKAISTKEDHYGMKLFPLFQVNAWFNHGWIYYFYFTGYSLLIKTVAILLLSALVKEMIYLLINDPTSQTGLVIELILPYIYGHALIISFCLPIIKTYAYHRKQIEWSESQFSFLVKNLPLDMSPNELKEELTKSLNTLFQEKGIQGQVRDIIFIQDCKEYIETTNEIRSIKAKIIQLQNKNASPDQKTLNRLTYCEARLSMLTTAAEKFMLFRGRAILILDSIWAKKLVKRVLRGRFFLWPSFKVQIHNRSITFSEIYEPSEMRYSYLNERFWFKFLVIISVQLLLLSGLYISLQFRVSLLESAPNSTDPWDNIQNMAQVTATVIYSSISFLLLMFLQNFIPYASKTTKYRFYIVYGVSHANLTISYIYETYLAQQGLEWTLSKVIYGMALFLLTNTGLRVLGYGYQIRTASRAVLEENKQIDFDFWPSFNNIYQFLVLGIYYMALRPIIIFSVTIVMTIIIMMIDKWFILKHTTKTSKLQSFETGFNLYLVIPINLILRYFTITYFVQVQLIQAQSLEYSTSVENVEFYTSISNFLNYFSDACLSFWAVLLSIGGYVLLRDIFNQVNAENRVSYDSVSSYFKSFYAREYPLYELQKQASISKPVE